MGKKILNIIKYYTLPYRLFLKYVWRYFDYENYPHMYMEKEDYQKAIEDYEKKLKKDREEEESKIFRDKIMDNE